MDKSSGSITATIVGRYSIHSEIAHGGMATVHVGRLMGPVGFSRTVAIKRLHSLFAKDPEFVAMFMDEARLAARVQHPNVVSIIDVVAESGELLLVMDYIQGESLSRLLRAERAEGSAVDPRIAVKVMTEVLSGLHAAHEARNERGTHLGIVHRDVSPQNVLVGVDGVAHLIDFGVAKAAGRVQSTRDGQLKGKLAYMAPEQIRSTGVDRRTDIYAASAVLWEVLAGRRLFTGNEANLMYAVLTVPIAAPSTINPAVSPELDAVVMKGLQKNPAKRFGTALEMADALEAAIPPASSREVARWMERLAAKALGERASLVAEVESISHVSMAPPPGPGLRLPEDWSASGTSQAAPEVPRENLPPAEAVNISLPDIPTDTSSSISSANITRKPAGKALWVAIALGAATVAGAISFWIVSSSASKSASANTPDSPVSGAQPLPVQSDRVAESAPPIPAADSAPPIAPPVDSGATAAKASKPPAGPAVQPASPVPPAAPGKKKQTYTRD